ncbi:MAG: hypothetical protein KA004_17435 [Verrucomicrobiales bacterium]|nr:hypothetical protein [Verrucomicrobiales bacterium]
MFPATSRFQTDDARFAAAAMDLGMPMQRSCMKHLDAASQKHNATFLTFSLASDGEQSPHALYTALCEGSLIRRQPAHPVFAALAGIDNYTDLIAEGAGMASLVPLHPEHFRAGINRLCILRPARKNDGNLSAHCRPADPGTRSIDLDPEFAAVAALCAFPMRLRAGTNGRYRVWDGPSLAFPGLTLADLLLSFRAYDAEVHTAAKAAPLPLDDPHRNIPLAHAMPGFTAGDHPAQHAYNAIRIYRVLTGDAARRPNTLLFTANFAALIPTDADPATQRITQRFLTQGGSVFLDS